MLFPFIILTLTQVSFAGTPNDVIYGEDNRVETVDSKSAFHKKLAASTAAHILRSDIHLSGGKATFKDQVLNDFIVQTHGRDLCEGERFKDQVIASNCSGFLVAPDIIVSAGHCFRGNSCATFDFVFNFKTARSTDKTVTINEGDVYHCKEVIARMDPDEGDPTDYAVVRLDRPVKGVEPLKVAAKTPSVGTPLVLIGHPSGLPQKISDGASVKKIIPTGFNANVDAFGGNSGSAVFNDRTGEVVGILVNGAEDYSLDSSKGCFRVAKLSQEDGQEGVSGVELFLPFLKQ